MKTSKSMLLVTVIAVTAVLGTWLLLSPTVEKQNNLDKQSELLKSMIESDSEAVVDEPIPIQTIDFYDEPIPETESTAPSEAEIVIEPLSETELLEIAAINGIGILTIDKIDLKLPVVDGVTVEQLKIAVGHVPQTAAIGELGNAVIAGHRNYTYGDYFNRLGEMAIGDIIGYKTIDGESMRFEVFEITEILPDDQTAFIQPKDESIITLYTCTPIKTATHRLLVRAKNLTNKGGAF